MLKLKKSNQKKDNEIAKLKRENVRTGAVAKRK
jgi:hypothetical protein